MTFFLQYFKIAHLSLARLSVTIVNHVKKGRALGHVNVQGLKVCFDLQGWLLVAWNKLIAVSSSMYSSV